MDKFTGRRRATWQSKAPLWPFLVLAFVLAVIICLVASPYAGGVILGDGTSGGRAMVWVKTLSNIVIPALVVGAVLGGILHQMILAPAGRYGAMKWTGLLILAGALAGAPLSIARGVEADRLGYELRLKKAVTDARGSSRRAEHDFNRRMRLVMRNDPFEPAKLAAPNGLQDAEGAITNHKSLLASARRDYDAGQVEARAALAAAIVDESDRSAVLERFDIARVERKALMEKIWAAHDRIIALNEEELGALRANRGAWRATPGGASVSSMPLLNRLRRISADLRTTAAEHDRVDLELQQLDARTDAGIDRVLDAAVKA